VTVRVWDTRKPRDPEFAATWAQRLSRAPMAHFALDLDFLAWNADRGEHARAALLDEGDRAAMLVLRHTPDGWVSGWPWRWQAAFEGASRTPPPGFDLDEGRWLFEQARALAGDLRLRMHLPYAPALGVPGYVAGNTLFHDVAHDDGALLRAMDPTKRRSVRRAQDRGYRVSEATTAELFRGFAEVQRLTDERHGHRAAPLPEAPSAGVAWREWELPWMWLTVATREGRVESGLGYGTRAGGLLEGRTGASTADARREGAFPLLVYEGAKLARDRGYAYINVGGDTFFKRDTLGTLGRRVTTWTWLGGGARWMVPNAFDAGMRRTRAHMASALRARMAASHNGKGGVKPETAKPKRAVADRTGRRVTVWSTREARDGAFAGAWQQVLRTASRSSFAMELGFVEWEAKHGRHSIAAIVEHGSRRGILVLRETRRTLTCGWPWRWQVALQESRPAPSPVFNTEESAWLFEQACHVAGRRRLICHLPAAPAPGVPGYESGRVIIQSLQRDDDELLNAMRSSKRRMVRKARDSNYQVVEGGDEDQRRAFAVLQRITRLRHGQWAGVETPPAPAPGEAWREWELPWMWLLLALREGVVESGLGDGIRPGGILEGRTGASSDRARQDGAFALLCHEEMRRGRDRGHVWLNHGGDTSFKRDIAGTLAIHVPVFGWLGGGRAWSLANHSEAWALRARPRLSAWMRRVAQATKGHSA
jgi:hypothetical protein